MTTPDKTAVNLSTPQKGHSVLAQIMAAEAAKKQQAEGALQTPSGSRQVTVQQAEASAVPQATEQPVSKLLIPQTAEDQRSLADVLGGRLAPIQSPVTTPATPVSTKRTPPKTLPKPVRKTLKQPPQAAKTADPVAPATLKAAVTVHTPLAATHTPAATVKATPVENTQATAPQTAVVVQNNTQVMQVAAAVAVLALAFLAYWVL